MATDIGVLSSPEAGRFFLLIQSFPGSLRLVHADASGVLSESRFGKGFPFGGRMIAMMFIPYGSTMFLPILLAFILSALMRKHRICEYRAGSQIIPMASLFRRALAQLIDFAILLSPFLIAFLFIILPDFHIENMFLSKSHFLLSMVFIIGGLLCGIICLLMYSFLEGKWGITPGKWAVGIRVLGMDLNPCGFGRALVRNLLKFIDGFFNFMVGIMVVALSENWQRVGDMAARTVVIHARK